MGKKTSAPAIAALMLLPIALALYAPGCKGGPSKQETAAAELKNGIEDITGDRVEEGLAHLRKAEELDPKNPKTVCAQGSAYRKMKQLDKAVELYKKAIELDHMYFVCYDNLGLAYAEMGKDKEAEESFFKATRIAPRYADAWYNLGALYDLKLDNKERAVWAYEEYIALGKDAELIKEVKERVKKIKGN